MKTIWKFTIQPSCEIIMPVGAKLLDVQEQHGEAQLWALVDPNAEKETRRFTFYGTGHDVSDDPGTYIGTFQLHGGGLVFHGFEHII